MRAKWNAISFRIWTQVDSISYNDNRFAKTFSVCSGVYSLEVNNPVKIIPFKIKNIFIKFNVFIYSSCIIQPFRQCFMAYQPLI